MKILLIALLSLSSISTFASTCPEINGVFVCVGEKLMLSEINRVTSKVNSDGRSEIYINQELYRTEGKSQVVCDGSSYKSKELLILKTDDNTFSVTKRYYHPSSGKVTNYQTDCFRIR